MRRVLGTIFAGTLMLATVADAQLWEVRNRLLTDPEAPSANDRFGAVLAVGDFDGDGADDLVVRSTFGSPGSGGELHLFLGGPAGPSPAVDGKLTPPAGWAGFGAALLAVDLDVDPEDELVVGVPDAPVEKDGEELSSAGLVAVYDWTGAAWSLVATFSQESPGVPGAAERNDLFGSALTAGDFDGDGWQDVAVGAPAEAISTTLDAGAVNVLYGSANGLTAVGAQVWFKGTPGQGERFGAALAAGDFDGDGLDDLAVGVPGIKLSDVADTGQVIVFFGTAASGLTSTGAQTATPLTLGEPAAGQRFGSRLAAGDSNPSDDCQPVGECADDLLVGAPGSPVDWNVPVSGAGRAWLLPGSAVANGLDLFLAVPLDQGEIAPGSWTVPESGDSFGGALAIGRLDPDGADDLVVGSPGESFEALEGAGCAHLLAGGSLAVTPLQYVRGGQPGAASAPLESHEEFAGALAVGDFDGDGWGDLAIGLPSRDVDAEPDSGAVQILFGALFADGFERGTVSAWAAP